MTGASYQLECPNDECSQLKQTGRRRHIGLDNGSGGQWQCRKCGAWLNRGAGESRRAAQALAYVNGSS